MKYNDKNQVQSGIDDSGDNQGIQRAAAVTELRRIEELKS